MSKVYFGGAYTDPDTRDMLAETQRVSGRAILLTQGSYSTTVTASGGTHDGGGVVDINVYGWSSTTIWHILTVSRSMGGIAWYRTPAQGFAYHIHVVRRDCGDLSAAARAQVVQYLDGQNGLANHGPDDGPLGYTSATWAGYKAGTSAYRPPIDTEDDMANVSNEQLNLLLDAANRVKNIETALQYPGSGGKSWSQALANLANDNQKAVLKELAAIRNQLTNIERQGWVTTTSDTDWLPKLGGKLDAILQRLG